MLNMLARRSKYSRKKSLKIIFVLLPLIFVLFIYITVSLILISESVLNESHEHCLSGMVAFLEGTQQRLSALPIFAGVGLRLTTQDGSSRSSTSTNSVYVWRTTNGVAVVDPK